ncbi:MAG: glycine betaine ABC transporter substrate-binding protein, partial [Phycisphaerales bacterium]
YTGTLMGELLVEENLSTTEQLRAALESRGIRMSEPIGFNNTYAVGVTRETAERLDLETISDLADHPEIRMGFSNEFMDRADGWPGLRDAYGLRNPARGMDHDLAYRGLQAGSIGAMDLYATDAEIEYYDLVVLDDDLGYFPRYDAVVLWRADLEQRMPNAADAIGMLEGAIDEDAMSAMNRLAKIGRSAADGEDGPRVPASIVAKEFLADAFDLETEAFVETRRRVLIRTTIDHLELVAWSMAAAILIAIPLGMTAAKNPRLAQPILWCVGILQTMPSLALLVLLIPAFGLTPLTAIVALFLYSLLPIVRNTYAGLTNIPGDVMESAVAIGLTATQRMRDVELPLALPTILAGIKTAVVINVGTATLAALIGVGGYGQPILTGIRLDDFGLILLGAGPAAAMAISAQLLFDGFERLAVSRGLRL